MLQQTQVDRVIPKYESFLNRFPSFSELAAASKQEVLRFWSGLGYNRRGLNLQKAAMQVIALHQGKLPSDHQLLDSLPGIGPATASSIQAFAFNLPSVFIETNVRSVFIHEFFPTLEKVPDSKILSLVGETLDRDNPRKWYNALMDYGTMLKSLFKNPSKKSLAYAKQSKFSGSKRQIRGYLLKLLLEKPRKLSDLPILMMKFNAQKLEEVISDMRQEKIIQSIKGFLAVAD